MAPPFAFFESLFRSPRATEPPAPAAKMSNAATQLHNLNRRALETTLSAAQHDGRQFQIAEYFANALELAEKGGIEANAATIANLSGQTIKGALINKVELYPSKELQAYAVLKATEALAANNEFRAPTATESLRALTEIQRQKEPLPSGEALTTRIDALNAKNKEHGVRDFKDLMDLDGNHVINKFYEEVDRHLAFKGTVFDGVTFHPADTLMPSYAENRIPETEGAKFKNCTFDGMKAGDQLVLSGGEGNVLTNIKGGEITIEGVEKNLDISGVTASLALHPGARIEGLKAVEAHVLNLQMEKGSSLRGAVLQGTSIDAASVVQGATLENIKIGKNPTTGTDSSLAHVSLREANVLNVTIEQGTNLGGLDVSGATLKNLRIGDSILQNAEDLKHYGITYDMPPRVIADQALVLQLATQQAGAGLLAAMNSLNTPQPPPAAPTTAPPLAALANNSGPSIISGGETVALDTALAGGFNAAKDLVARIQPETGQGWELGRSGQA